MTTVFEKSRNFEYVWKWDTLNLYLLNVYKSDVSVYVGVLFICDNVITSSEKVFSL